MIQENEVVMLLLGVIVLIFMLGNRPPLKRLPAWSVLLAAFCTLVGGWTLTVLEGFFWTQWLNLAEHVCYAANSVLVAVWCWMVFTRAQQECPR